MTAGSGRDERAALAASATALLALLGQGRAAQLSAALAGREREGVALKDLALAPRWSRRDGPYRTDLARRAALVSMSDHLSASIDGDWLAGLAAVAGDRAMDDILRRAPELPPSPLPPVNGSELDERGVALLVASLPPQLRAGLSRGEEVEQALAAACVSEAEDVE